MDFIAAFWSMSLQRLFKAFELLFMSSTRGATLDHWRNTAEIGDDTVHELLTILYTSNTSEPLEIRLPPVEHLNREVLSKKNLLETRTRLLLCSKKR